MSSDDPDSPLMNLNRDVKLAILKQLEFREYRNLALTCKKWYEVASTAPTHVKPQVKFDTIRVTIFEFVADHNDKKDKFPLSIRNTFELVSKIKCDLSIMHGLIREELDPAVAYILKNRDKFSFKTLHWSLHPRIPLEMDKFRLITDLAKYEVFFSVTEWMSYKPLLPQNRECITKFIEEDRRLNTIHCDRIPVEIFKTVLKQVVDGHRPGLYCFDVLYEESFPSKSWLANVLSNPTTLPSSSVEEDENRWRYTLMTADQRRITVHHDTDLCTFEIYASNILPCYMYRDTSDISDMDTD